jgi:hypothetical protein
MVTSWLIGAALAMSMLAFDRGGGALFVPAIVLALGSFLGFTRHALRRADRDWLVPVVVILGIWIIRYAVPGLFLLIMGPQGVADRVALFRSMRLSATDWQNGFLLVTIGMLAVIVGWITGGRGLHEPRMPQFAISAGAKANAMFAMAIGLGALLLFVSLNAGLLQAVASGSLRGTAMRSRAVIL